MDGARVNYQLKFKGDACCRQMRKFLGTGACLSDLTTAARKLSGGQVKEVRFCPWCGWDNARKGSILQHQIDLKKHIAAFNEEEQIDLIGARR